MGLSLNIILTQKTQILGVWFVYWHSYVNMCIFRRSWQSQGLLYNHIYFISFFFKFFIWLLIQLLALNVIKPLPQSKAGRNVSNFRQEKSCILVRIVTKLLDLAWKHKIIHKQEDKKKPKETFMQDQCSMDFQTKPTCPHIKSFDMTVTIATTKLFKEQLQQNTNYLFTKKSSFLQY